MPCSAAHQSRSTAFQLKISGRSGRAARGISGYGQKLRGSRPTTRRRLRCPSRRHHKFTKRFFGRLFPLAGPPNMGTCERGPFRCHFSKAKVWLEASKYGRKMSDVAIGPAKGAKEGMSRSPFRVLGAWRAG